MKYFLMNDGSVMRGSDLALIPPTEENADYRAYLADDTKVVEPFDYSAEEARQVTAAKVLANDKIKEKLADIDLRSIRAIREYIAAKADATQILKDREAEAVAERERLT
jgi:hypothetical protein